MVNAAGSSNSRISASSESVGNYAKVYFGPNKPLILKSLNALEERLDEKVFFRANRKHIVNLRLIEKIEPYFNGGLLLEMKGGEKDRGQPPDQTVKVQGNDELVRHPAGYVRRSRDLTFLHSI